MSHSTIQQSQVFYVAAMIAGALITRYMRMPGTLEQVTKRLHDALTGADSITVECIGNSIPDNATIAEGYDAACHRDDLAVYE